MTSADPESKCALCYEHRAVWFVDPCLHFVCCDACFDKLAQTEFCAKCALCRTVAHGYSNRESGEQLTLEQVQHKARRRPNIAPPTPEELRCLRKMYRREADGRREYRPDQEDSDSSSDDDNDEDSLHDSSSSSVSASDSSSSSASSTSPSAAHRRIMTRSQGAQAQAFAVHRPMTRSHARQAEESKQPVGGDDNDPDRVPEEEMVPRRITRSLSGSVGL